MKGAAIRVLSVALLGAPILGGCSKGGEDSIFAAPADSSGSVVPGSLRVDVLPPSSVDGLLPQTEVYSPERWESGFSFDLKPTVEVSGTVFGDVAYPWSGFAPTRAEALSATLTATSDGLLDGGATATDPETGAFSLMVPAGRGYAFSVVPQNADTSPFYFEPDQAFINDARDFSLSIGMGLPVYGRVTDAGGAPLAGVPLRVERLIDGLTVVTGATFNSDPTGWYSTRILPVEGASFRVAVVEGKAGGDLFASRAFDVALDPENGARVDVSVGATEKHLVRGDVVDSEGHPVEAEVRLTSMLLEGGGGLTVETTVTTNGTFYADVLPGRYQLEVYPPYEVVVTPFRDIVEVGGDDVEKNVVLAAPTLLQGRVVDQQGDPVGKVSISAAQQGYGGYVFSGETMSDGTFAMTVPDTDFDVTFTPELPSEDGAITTVPMSPADSVEVTLAKGSVVSGSVTWEGAPLAFAPVQVLDARTGVLLGYGLTDADGNVSLAVDIPEESTVTRDGEDGDATESGDAGADTGGADTGEGETDTGAGGSDTASSGGDTASSGGDTATGGGDTADSG